MSHFFIAGGEIIEVGDDEEYEYGARTMRIAGTRVGSLTDGPGARFSIYCQGCSIRCSGCQVPHLWRFDGGEVVEIEALAEEALASGLPVSILGGEPFDQPQALYQLLLHLREGGVPHVITYTGYTFEALLERALDVPRDPYWQPIWSILKRLDVLVDGPFDPSQDHDRLQYRGSANQRVINLPATLALSPSERLWEGPVLLNWDVPEVIHTPYRAPNANAYAERWIRSVREECLDKLLIINQTHLRRVMREYVSFFNTARPHQGINQQIPIPKTDRPISGPVRCHNVLGGIIHDYYRDAA